MFDLIDLYVKEGARWQWFEHTRMHKTLVSAQKAFSDLTQREVKARFAAGRSPRKSNGRK